MSEHEEVLKAYEWFKDNPEKLATKIEEIRQKYRAETIESELERKRNWAAQVEERFPEELKKIAVRYDEWKTESLIGLYWVEIEGGFLVKRKLYFRTTSPTKFLNKATIRLASTDDLPAEQVADFLVGAVKVLRLIEKIKMPK